MKFDMKGLRAQIAIFGPGRVPTGSPLHQSLLEIIQVHPNRDEKIGAGISHFKLAKSRVGKGLATFLVRTDGSQVDFSWARANEYFRLSESRTRRRRCLEAMRDAIRSEIFAFKSLHLGKPCALCGGTHGEFHVDHAHPTFGALADHFLEMAPELERAELVDDPDRGGKKFVMSPAVEGWQDFHRCNSVLRWLCASCNLRRPRLVDEAA